MDRDTHSLKATVSSYTKYAKDLGPYSVPEEEKVKGNVITESSLSALSQSSKASPSSTNKCNIALGGLARSESTGRIVKHVVSHSPFCQLELWDLPPELLQSDSESSPSLEDIMRLCSYFIKLSSVILSKRDSGTCGWGVTRYWIGSSAFSQVLEKLHPQTCLLERLLDTFVGYSGIENAFLFDAVSKLVVATDSSPVHGNDFELCSDMIEVAIDISGIYSFGNPRNHTKEDSIQDSHPVGEESFILDHWNISSSCGYFFQDSSCWCTIRLGNGIVLHMKSVGHYLCLVLMARGEILDSNWGLVGYNIRVFSECLSKVIKSTRCCDA
ncbi:Ras-related GTP-binding protein C [Galdieria sulphuraria]|nr:Ras-related GTP-binding protein C [Galdieria sulphuraria]